VGADVDVDAKIDADVDVEMGADAIRYLCNVISKLINTLIQYYNFFHLYI
jgi:hypothetical protein